MQVAAAAGLWTLRPVQDGDRLAVVAQPAEGGKG